MTDPLQRLRDDRQRARSLEDPCAALCTLANIDAEGMPQARTLVLRELDGQLAVFINQTSPKWTHLVSGPASLVVWLPSLKVQYRLACNCTPVAQALVHDSWHLRPEPPKRMDWFYTLVQPQSSSIASRAELLNALESLDLPDPLTAPASAHGLYLSPSRIERLHLGEDNGVHDRLLYRLDADAWTLETLVP
jgi:pyridoxine/pyridoxamine 5'-phosphate oxidase